MKGMCKFIVCISMVSILYNYMSVDQTCALVYYYAPTCRKGAVSFAFVRLFVAYIAN